jgi:predicted hydrocarbon binding protein
MDLVSSVSQLQDTTGLLNGFFSAVKNQHVKETKCIAAGDPCCEWEFR